MKSILRFMIVSLVTLVFAGVSSAQGTTGGTGAPAKAPSTSTTTTKSASTSEKKAPAAKTLRARGELTAADAKTGMVKVKTKDKELSLSADTPEVKDSLTRVKVGDAVRVAYVESDGKLALKSIAKTKLPTAKSTTSSTTTKAGGATETKPATK
jgi:hypothetical protein